MSRVNLDRHQAAVEAMRAIEQSRRPANPPDCACALTGTPCPDVPRRVSVGR